MAASVWEHGKTNASQPGTTPAPQNVYRQPEKVSFDRLRRLRRAAVCRMGVFRQIHVTIPALCRCRTAHSSSRFVSHFIVSIHLRISIHLDKDLSMRANV